MTKDQLLAKGMLAELAEDEQKHNLIAEDNIGTIHNLTSPLAMLTINDYTELNVRMIQASLDRVKESQEALVQIREKVSKINRGLNG